MIPPETIAEYKRLAEAHRGGFGDKLARTVLALLLDREALIGLLSDKDAELAKLRRLVSDKFD